MKQIIHLTSEEVIEIHTLLISETGGSPGLRDRGLLESALHRPQSGYYETLFDQAAALFESLVLNHVFLDGNKRIAITASGVFLRANGYKLRTSAEDGENFIIEKVIRSKISLSEISKWFNKNATKI